ncbi:MAG: hypothetical protein IPL74_07990 [Bacteroidetes bacterium]|nr:hypothetical protein [Bacteroidota bacterium]
MQRTVTVNQLPLPVITGDLEICDGEITTLAATPGYATYTGRIMQINKYYKQGHPEFIPYQL